MRRVAYGGALVLIGFILLGFTGRYFALGNAAAVGRLQAAVFLVPWAALLWFLSARRLAFLSLVLTLWVFASVAPGLFAAEQKCSEPCLTLYQKNLLSRAWPRYPLADDIVQSGADIVTLQEVSDHNRRYMGRLFNHYHTSVSCKFRPAQDVAILTSLPAVPGSEFCLEGAGLAGIQVRTTDGHLLWVVSVHLEWPFPYEQSNQVRIITKRLRDLKPPVLVAGDFNNMPWAGSVKKIMDAAKNQHLGAFRNTFRWGGRLLPLPLDRVLVPKGSSGDVALRPYMGSDHLGLLAHITLPAPKHAD